jgi:type I site-specific restriction-modification system R (restriction) subunit
MKRIIKVEDSHGVAFHRELIKKLKERGLLGDTVHNPLVERLNTGKCNLKLVRTILTRLVGENRLKVLFVVDSEGRADVAYNDILKHFKKKRPGVERLDVKVVVVEPRHEAWLCIGLGGDRKKCRSNPEEVISRIKNNQYKKWKLSDWAQDVDISNFLSESDFKDYIQGVKWLLEDC